MPLSALLLSCRSVWVARLLRPRRSPASISKRRTCDVWTGPCFGNAQMGQAGKEAVMAWKVDEGSFSGVSLDGLGVALVVNADGNAGNQRHLPDEGRTTSVR